MTTHDYHHLVNLQKAFFNEHITREIPYRLCALDRLAEGIADREKQLAEALRADLGKSPFESYVTEIGILLHEIRIVKNNLQSWARDRRRPTPLFLFGSHSRIHYEPYGCVLIVAPWNYPLQLALSPLVGAIAAGNCAIIKPSGEAPHTTQALQELIGECFEEEYIAVADDRRETTEELLQERFPQHKAYRNLVRQGFQRPSFLVAAGRQTMADATARTVERTAQVTVTLFAAVDDYHDSQAEALAGQLSSAMELFSVGAIQAGDRYLDVGTVSGTVGWDFAELTIPLSWQDDRELNEPDYAPVEHIDLVVEVNRTKSE